MAAAHAQQVHADWDTMVAEFDSAMAAAPDQLIAARAAWARGEKAATSDKPAPQEIEELHEQQENDLTTPTGRDALTPHSGVTLTSEMDNGRSRLAHRHRPTSRKAC